MQTIKTAVVVVLLLAVCYGAWVSLNSPDVDMPPSIDEWVSGEEDLDSLIGFNDDDLMSIDSAVPMTPDQFLASLEAEAEPTMSLPAEGSVALPTFPGAMSATEQPPTQPTETVSPSSTSAVGGSLPAIPQLPTDEQLSSFPALDTQLPASAVASEPQLPPALPTLPSDNSAGSAAGVDATPVATTTNMMAGPASTESLVPDMDIGQPPLPAETESAMAGEAGSLATSLPTMDFAMARDRHWPKLGVGNSSSRWKC